MDAALLQRANSAVARAFEIVEVEKRGVWGSSAGKAKVAQRIVEFLPAHKTYVEPFVGSGAVLFVKEPAEREVINDVDEDIAKAFRIIKGLRSEDVDQLERRSWVGSRKTYDSVRASNPSDKIGWLYKFLYESRFSYRKIRGSGYDSTADGVEAGIIGRLRDRIDRLAGVEVCAGDYKPIIEKYDSPDTVFYLDPPYVGYDGDVGERKFDEEEFFEALKGICGRFVLTYGLKGKLPKLLRSESHFRVRRFGIIGSTNKPFDIIATNFDVKKSEVDAVSPIQQKRSKRLLDPVEPSPPHDIRKLDGIGTKDSMEKIRDVATYDPGRTTNAQLRDDFRIALAWFATWKRDPEAIRFSRVKIKEVLTKIVREAVKRGPSVIRFSPKSMRPAAREIFEEVTSDVSVPDEQMKMAGWTHVDKKLSPKQQAEYDAETEAIRENSKKPEASKRHKFRRAKWTHPNGHPRCMTCGDEETMSGYCNSPDIVEESVSDRFHELREAEPDFDTLKDWDRLLNRARRDVLTTKADAAIKVPLVVAEALASGAQRLATVSKRNVVGKRLVVTDGDTDFGVVELGDPERIDLWEFAERAGEHGIGEADRKRLWPNAKFVWSYGVEKFESFDGTSRVELSDGDVDALRRAKELAAAFDKAVPAFVERNVKLLRGVPKSEKSVLFLQDLPDIAANIARELGRVRMSAADPGATPDGAVAIGEELLKQLDRVITKVPSGRVKQALERGVSALRELARLSREELTRQGGHISIAARDTAPVHPSGKKKLGAEIELSDVIGHVKPIVLRRNAVALVGGLCNWGRTKNDIDVLMRGPLDDETEHVMKFRLGRMFPADLSRRIQFLRDDELGGPFTDHVELYDLALVPRSHDIVDGGKPEAFKVIEMRELVELVEKQDDPLLDIPKTRGGRPAVFQFHFRGRSLHGDLRNQVDDTLAGWTLACQIEGKVPRVEDVREARRLARRFDVDGNFFLKDWTAPEGQFATPKGRMPKSWLDIEGEKFEPGEIGATRNEPGVIVRVTDPGLRVEYGLQKAWAHEYFYTGDPKFTGRLFFRMLTGQARPGQEEAGQTPRGRTYWKSFWAKELLPSVLNRRAVKTKSMPPDGYSAIPVSLEQVVPPELRYWNEKGEAARRVRDELVDARLFTSDNVKIVNGQFRRVITKTYLDLGIAHLTAKQRRVPYAVAWQFWKGQTVERAGPSRQVWHLVFPDKAGGFHAFKLQTNPTEGEQQISGVHRKIQDDELMSFEGEVKPGQTVGGESLNETKATPSWIRNVDKGRVEVLEDDGSSMRLMFRGEKMRGEYTLRQEEEGSDFWVLHRKGETKKSTCPTANVFAERDGALACVLCPPCDSVNLRVSKQEHGGARVACNDCGAVFIVPGSVADRNGTLSKAERMAAARKADAGPTVAYYIAMMEDAERDDDTGYELLKAIPMRDGVQVWDPKRNDPDADRSQLRPPAIYQPMKVPPRSTNEFRDEPSLMDKFATPTILQMGVIVEPKYNGFRISMQKRGDRVFIITEDEKRDLSKVLPGLVDELRKIHGDFVIDGEGMAVDESGEYLPRRELAQFRGTKPVDDSGLRIPVFTALYVPDAGNITRKSETERRRALEKMMRGKKGKRLFVAPFKMAKTDGELRSAIAWARRQPGSEGAMLKGVEATYSLGGENDLWAKFKVSRRLKAIVHERHPVKDSPGVFNFYGAVGPIQAGDADKWANTVEVGGRTYVPIGRTFNSKLEADVGDSIEVEVLEILLDKSRKKWRVRWFTPTVTGPAEKPSTLEQVESMLQPDEVKKLVDYAFEKEIGIVKAEQRKEERIVVGVVLEPNDGKGGAPLDPDTQTDVYSREEVREAAHKFMEHYGNMGLMHREVVNDKIKPLESYVAPCDLTITAPDGTAHKVREGTWMMVVRILDDALWDEVKRGKLTGFSIGGSALRKPFREAA